MKMTPLRSAILVTSSEYLAASSSSRAVTGALHYSKIDAPWTDSIAVLMGHHSRDLVNMS